MYMYKCGTQPIYKRRKWTNIFLFRIFCCLRRDLLFCFGTQANVLHTRSVRMSLCNHLKWDISELLMIRYSRLSYWSPLCNCYFCFHWCGLIFTGFPHYISYTPFYSFLSHFWNLPLSSHTSVQPKTWRLTTDFDGCRLETYKPTL